MDEIRNLDMEQIVTGMPGGFFIYHADGDEEIIYANSEVLYLYGCRTMEEFRRLTGNSFRGMVHPDDLEEVEESIARQIAASRRHMDYVEYRIVRKDGEIRWVEDFGHLLKSDLYGNVFYVFVSDATEKRVSSQEREQQYIDTIMEQEQVKKALQLTLHVYRGIYIVDLDKDYFQRIFPEDADENMSGNYRKMLEEHILKGIISEKDSDTIRKLLQPEALKEALMNEESVEYNYSRKYEEDAMERCSTLIAVTQRESGVPASVVVGIRSIENIVQREERQNIILESALLHAEQANEAKTTFLANMSHDIRTPMNAIIGFTDLALGHIDDREQVLHCLEKIKQSSDLLLDLINDILDMSRLESGKMEIEKKESHLERVMYNIWQMLQKKILEKNLSYEADLSKVKNPRILCDELRLTQILINIVGNAVKYTDPGGSVHVKVTQTASLGRGVAYYEFRVKDTGIGIAPEFVSKMFTPFEREKTSTVSKIAGTGLGLAITKNLVDLMNGSIEVRSKLGEGSEFIIKIPFQIVRDEEKSGSAGAESADDQIAQEETFHGKRILLVEDNELNREIARTLLEEQGMIVDEAEDGEFVTQKLLDAETPYDCIIMDIQMPHMNGYSATKAVREMEDPVLAATPIIGMSANAFEEDRERSLEIGMNAHIPKPIDMKIVLGTLREFL